MSEYIKNINEVRDAVVTLLTNAKIKNNKNLPVTIYKRNIPKNFGKDKCPAISVYKTRLLGHTEFTDQAQVEVPYDLRIMLGISDYSLDDLDEAEVKTDDLIDKIITALEEDPDLGGSVKGIRVTDIRFDEDRRDGVWFSEPSIELTISCHNYTT